MIPGGQQTGSKRLESLRSTMREPPLVPPKSRMNSGLLSVGSLNFGDEPRLLSPEEVAKACRLSRRAVYRAIERGELPAARLCSRLRIRFEDFESWFATNRVEPVKARLATSWVLAVARVARTS